MVIERIPIVAGSFYPRTESACRESLEACLAAVLPAAQERAGRPRVGVVPHAGWMFSGPTAATTFVDFAQRARDTRAFVLLGAVHVGGVSRPTIFSTSPASWKTPLGAVPLDAAIAKALLAALRPGFVEVATEAHEDEHSIEVQLPFIAHLFPRASIVPIAVPPHPSAIELGAALAEVVRAQPDVAIIASSDLTHYGPRYHFTPRGRGEEALAWVREVNDAAILERITELDAEALLPMARSRQNACGAGAVTAAIAAARALGATRADVLAYTTSADVRPELGGRENFVGYAAATASCAAS